jgi:hypothetical protein
VNHQLAVVIAHRGIVEVCCGVKHLLAVVTVDSETVEVKNVAHCHKSQICIHDVCLQLL